MELEKPLNDDAQPAGWGIQVARLVAGGALVATVISGCSASESGHGTGAGPVSAHSSQEAAPVSPATNPDAIPPTATATRISVPSSRATGGPAVTSQAPVNTPLSSASAMRTVTIRGGGTAGAGSSQEITRVRLSCLEPLASSDAAHMADCRRVETGEVAVVDYGPPHPADAYDIRQAVSDGTDELQAATNGYVDLKPVYMPASAAARAAVAAFTSHEAGGAPCIPRPPQDSEARPQLAHIADQTMYLQQYDLVVAVGGEQCSAANAKNYVAGVADPAAGEADVYSGLAADSLQRRDTLMGEAFAHEVGGHLFGLGHKWAENCGPTDQQGQDGPFDLRVYFAANCTVDQYGADGNMMSRTPAGDSAPADTLLDPLQNDYLHETDAQFSPTHVQALQAGLSVTLSPVTPDSYATLPLPANFPRDRQFAAFDQLDFMPVATTDTNGIATTGIRVMANTPMHPAVVSSAADSLLQEVILGDFSFNSDGTMQFSIGQDTVSAVLNGDGSILLTYNAG